MILLRLLRDRFVDFQRIVVKEFFAGFNVMCRIDEDAALFQDRFAIWIARMVDPARFVAVDRGVDYFPVLKPENERMRIIFIILRPPPRLSACRYIR